MTNRVSLKPQVWNLFFLKCSLFILLYVSMFKMTLRRFDKKWLLDNIIYFISLNQLHFYNHFNCHKYKKFSQWQKKWPWQKCFLPFNERLLKLTKNTVKGLIQTPIHERVLVIIKALRGEGTGSLSNGWCTCSLLSSYLGVGRGQVSL